MAAVAFPHHSNIAPAPGQQTSLSRNVVALVGELQASEHELLVSAGAAVAVGGGLTVAAAPA